MKISIVTISFNQAPFLRECIESVLSQNYPDLEYIVVDPGSTDGSRDLIRSYGNKVIQIFEPDKGPANGLNKGFSLASGEICGYLNSDDRLIQGTLDWISRYFEFNREVDVLCGAISIIDEKGRRHRRRRTPDKFDLVNYALGICTIGQQGTFFRRSAFEQVRGFNESNRTCWDGELLVDMKLNGCKFAEANKVLGEFRIYPQSITGSQRYSDLFVVDMDRIREKILLAGYKLPSPLEVWIRRLFYKVNLSRHIRYVRAR